MTKNMYIDRKRSIGWTIMWAKASKKSSETNRRMINELFDAQQANRPERRREERRDMSLQNGGAGIAANCAAPAKTKTDMPSASMVESPLSIAVAPKATPNGIRASNTGTMAFAPATNAAAGDSVFGSSSIAPWTSLAMLSGRIRPRPIPKCPVAGERAVFDV
jgi:hypothetical protein